MAAYLGDVAVASVREPAGAAAAVPLRGHGGAIELRMQRHYQDALSPATVVPTGRAQITGVEVALDFRSDALLVWTTANGTLFACDVPEHGAHGPIQRLGRLSAGAVVQALLSDDNRAIVAWITQRPGRGGGWATRVRVDISGPRVRSPRGADDARAPTSRPRSRRRC